MVEFDSIFLKVNKNFQYNDVFGDISYTPDSIEEYKDMCASLADAIREYVQSNNIDKEMEIVVGLDPRGFVTKIEEKYCFSSDEVFKALITGNCSDGLLVKYFSSSIKEVCSVDETKNRIKQFVELGEKMNIPILGGLIIAADGGKVIRP